MPVHPTIEPTIRILIADDHAMVLDGIITIISSDSHCQVVAKAHDGQQALELYTAHRPDIAILDYKMPKLDGIDVIKQIKTHSPDAKIIILSGHDAEEYIYKAVQAGAMGYVLKESLLDDLMETIYAVYQGKRVLESKISEKYVMRTTRVALSERELEILEFIAQGNTNEAIANSLHLSEGTVKIHVHNILKKLNVPDRTTAVIEGIRRGLVDI